MHVTPAARPPERLPSKLRIARDVEVSVIIPTLNEAKNLQAVVERIDESLRGWSHEIIVVDDDSRDETPAMCAALSDDYSVRLIVRANPKDGLSGAVLHGMALARGEKLVVMDADLQHPPEMIPALLASLDSGESDFAIGSRYVEGASTGESWGQLRRWNSKIATLLARPIAGKTRDPMSGFFALRRETYEAAARLAPLGYKIALELMCKCGVRRVSEVPIHFGRREAGESKLGAMQQLRYLRHLARLYAYKFPRAVLGIQALASVGIGWGMGLFTNGWVGGTIALLSTTAMAMATRRGATQTTRRPARDARVFGFAELNDLSEAA